MSRRLLLLLPVLLVALAAPSRAGRPLVAEDAAVQGRGSCEIEAFGGSQREQGAAQIRLGSAQLGCGIGWATQLAMNAVIEREDDQNGRALALSGKTALNAAAEGAPAWALAWSLIGNRPPGESFRHSLNFLNGILTLPLNDTLRMHANVGWAHNRIKDQSSTTWALALERSGWQPGIDLMGEAFGSDRGREPWLQAGLRWAVIPDRFFIDGSAGVKTGGNHPINLTLGFKAAF